MSIGLELSSWASSLLFKGQFCQSNWHEMKEKQPVEDAGGDWRSWCGNFRACAGGEGGVRWQEEEVRRGRDGIRCLGSAEVPPLRQLQSEETLKEKIRFEFPDRVAEEFKAPDKVNQQYFIIQKYWLRGQHSTIVSILASVPSCPRFDTTVFEHKIVNVVEVNQRLCLEESGQWLENIDQTHLVLAGGKLVQQKKKYWHS